MSGMRLVTIPFSHYCEKARWALDRAGIAYVEEPHLPMMSWIAAKRAGGSRMVPVLVTPDGVVPDSTAIVAWCDARGAAAPLLGDPDADALEDRFDDKLGPHARRAAYAALLPSREAAVAMSEAAPAWEARVLRVGFPLIVRAMQRLLRIDAAAAARSRAIVDDIFAQVAARIADGRRYLVGDRFTAADLTFASLAAPVLAPAQYGGPLPPRSTWPAEFGSYVDAMRATPAGRFALNLYGRERAASPARAAR